jgi:hypothetical protein
MKCTLPLLLLLAGVVAPATPALSQAAAPPPILGSWAVDVTRLPVPPEARPKSVTMTFSDAGEGKYRTDVDIVLADGTESHGSSTYPLDGTAAPVIGSPEADVSAVTMPAPDVLVMVLGKDGMGGSTRVFTVIGDGAAMTETATYYRQDGTPVVRINHFTRVQ